MTNVIDAGNPSGGLTSAYDGGTSGSSFTVAIDGNTPFAVDNTIAVTFAYVTASSVEPSANAVIGLPGNAVATASSVAPSASAGSTFTTVAAVANAFLPNTRTINAPPATAYAQNIQPAGSLFSPQPYSLANASVPVPALRFDKNIVAVPGIATASSVNPSISNLSFASPPAALANASSVAPTIVNLSFANPPAAIATANILAPGIQAGTGITLPVPPATATANAVAPAVWKDDFVQVVVSSGTASAVAPTVTKVTVFTAVPAIANANAPTSSPSVSVTVSTAPSISSASAVYPVLTNLSGFTATPAAASAYIPIPIPGIVPQVPAASAVASSSPPSVGSITSRSYGPQASSSVASIVMPAINFDQNFVASSSSSYADSPFPSILVDSVVIPIIVDTKSAYATARTLVPIPIVKNRRRHREFRERFNEDGITIVTNFTG